MRKFIQVIITAVIIFILLSSSFQPAVAQEIGSGYSYGVDIDWLICFGQKVGAIPPTASMIEDLGAKSVRFNVVWGYVEPSEGQYDWTMLDAVVEDLPPDTEFVFTLFTSSPWATRTGTGEMAKGIPSPNFPEDLNTYKTYLRKIVGRYKDRVKYWQIDNEVLFCERFWQGTPEEYVQLLQTAYVTIKEVDPEAKVLLAGFALGSVDTSDYRVLRYFSPLVEQFLSECGDSFDILDIHLYWKWEAIPERITLFKDMLAGLGYDKPIWMTESGGPDLRACLSPEEFKLIQSELSAITKTGDPAKNAILWNNDCARLIYFDEYEEERFRAQAEELVKRFVLAYQSGAQRVFWMKLAQMGSWDLFWNKMALVDSYGAKRAGYTAYQLMMNMLGDFQNVRKLDTAPEISIFEFMKPEGAVYVGWTTQAAQVSIPYTKREAVIIDVFGNVKYELPKKGAITVNLTPTPVFIE